MQDYNAGAVGASDQLFYSAEDAAAVLGHIGRDKIYELIRDGELSSFKIGRRRVIPRSAIDAYAARKLAAAASGTAE